MAFSDFLLGTPAQTKQFARFAPNQQQLQNQVIGQLSSLLNGGVANGARPVGAGASTFAAGQAGSPSPIDPILKQVQSQFETQIIPGLAERFTSMGGGLRSSGFQGALAGAGSDLANRLAGLRANYQQNQLNQLLPYAFQPSFDTAYQPRQPGFLESSAAPLAQGFGSLLPLYLSGGGSGILQLLLSLLGKRNNPLESEG